MKKLKDTAPFFCFFALWEITSRAFNSDLFPPPSRVMLTTLDLIRSGVLKESFLKSLERVLVGYVSGSLFGIGLGILIGWKEKLDKNLSPIISLLYPIPALGWLPLFMLWFGTGELLPILVIFTCSFFPVLYETASGVRSISKGYVKAARTLGASGLKLLTSIVIPLSLPSILNGLRLEAGMAWRVVIAAEMVAIPTGIGALMMKAENLIMVDVIMACLIVLAFMCFTFERIILFLEKRTVRRWWDSAFRDS